ncbi:MAG TPA: arginase family protein [Candidatus Limnocylindria bacterium]|nr:arginase family protein [Candidatus Limnocylindria bacterium]
MSHTLLGLPSVDPAALAAGDADAVVLGVPFGVPYPTPGPAAGCAEAPTAIRARSQHLARFAAHHDFDLDGPMLPPGSSYRVADAGDVPGSAEDGAGNAAATEAVVRQLLGVGAVPLLLGGDDSVPIPLLRGYADHGPITVVQVDAHLDFRDERAGVRDGYSSAMRRASEMGHVQRIVQVGLRGVGSARPSDVADARAAGNLLVTARELDERGVPWLLGQLPADASVVVCFDLDGLDPSVAPAVSGTAPGGLSYGQAASLLLGLSARTRVAGAVFTEMVPALDVNDLTALVVVRLLSVLIGGLARRSIGS